ncbi:MAG: AraC family transcriptional regulator [Gammaproteobacteria bacterium]|nr:MAG: AraC family transcriptional regulator [Gammaproteobacteria bacterium]
MKIYIKNMVCDRCCIVVKGVLKELHLQAESVSLGEIDFADHYGSQLTDSVLSQLNNKLVSVGFEILTDKKTTLIEQIKISCLDYLNQADSPPADKLSSHLNKTLKRDYTYLSNLFSQQEEITIEHYFIRLRIEKVKELLAYGELSLSEIAFQLGFSSTAHLSSQFKKISGMTASQFRLLDHDNSRSTLDKL